MLFVLLSHFGFSFFPDQSAPVPRDLRLVGMIASPTFVMITGILIGFLHRQHEVDFARLRAKLVDRGLFLLTVGHLLILGSHAPAYTHSFWGLTDTVAVCMILQPWLLDHLKPAERVTVGITLFTISWLLVEGWLPHGHHAEAAKETLVGALHPLAYSYEFPVLPWFSLSLGASALGHKLAGLHAAGELRKMRRFVAMVAGGAITLACALRAIFALAESAALSGASAERLHPLFSPLEKQPPSPVYFLVYGAIGLTLVYAWLALEDRVPSSDFLSRAASLGQTSLFVFVVQWYVYLVGFYPFHHRLPFAWAWPIYLAVSVGVILTPARAWHRNHGNRFLTVGFSQWWLSNRRRHASVPVVTAPPL
jgi:hypothetical protein